MTRTQFETAPSLKRQWLYVLLDRWHQHNRRYLSGALRPPIFQLDDRSARLGSYTPTTRTITISVQHLWSDLWVDVELTLRHEMAHQVVHELFDTPNAPPHGRLFQKAMRMLSLEGSPRLAVDDTPDTVKVVKRIQKLLRLGQSDNPHEAQAALAAANRLLLRHNLNRDTTAQEEAYTWRWIGEPTRRISLEKKLLAGALQSFFFVQPIWVCTASPADDQSVHVLEISGLRTNLDIAEYTFAYIANTIEGLWRRFSKTLAAGQRRRARHDYRVGIVVGFCDQLTAQRERCAEEEGLIWLGDPALGEFHQRRYPRTRRLSSGYFHEGDALEAGKKAGRSIRLRAGLNRPSRPRNLLLE